MELHPLAEMFPRISPEEFESLKADIAKNGQLEPILMYEGKILDGRHRYEACQALGISPSYTTWLHTHFRFFSPIQAVISKNLNRRHLSAGQRAAIGLQLKEMLDKESEEEAAERRREVEQELEEEQEWIQKLEEEMRGAGVAEEHLPPEATPMPDRHHERKRGRPRKYAPANFRERIPENSEPARSTREVAAEALGVNAHYISDAEAIKKADPEIFEEVKAGTLTVPEAKRRIAKSNGRADRKQRTKSVKLVLTGKPRTDIEMFVGRFDPNYYRQFNKLLAERLG